MIRSIRRVMRLRAELRESGEDDLGLFVGIALNAIGVGGLAAAIVVLRALLLP